ncbi:MAG TPA: ATP-binding protein [Methylomirabilota bacterium]|nr:ATP-binding protein [Methylomirabilota bacterium]
MLGGSGVPLRRRLVLLAAAAIVPIVVMSGLGLHALAHQQQTQAERIGLELARALATAVDAELNSSISVLQSLAATLPLGPDHLSTFHQRVRPILETEPTWAAVFLADTSGRRLADTRFPLGTPLPSILERDSFDRVLRTHAPAVGGLARGAQGVMLFPVRAPVIRNGQLRYVLTALVKPDGIQAVIKRQRLPQDWVISIFDANGLRVARSRAHEENLGGRASESLRALMAAGGDEGVGQTVDLEGGRNYASFSRLKGHGWTVAPGIPAAFVEGAAYRSLAVYGSGILLSVVLGTLGALGVARSVNRPMGDLRRMAKALGRREPLALLDTPIQEIREVAEALTVAAAERTGVEAERERILRREQDARATAEAASRSKDEFLAILSHELRTPLNAVYGWARMPQSGQLRDEAATRAVDAIVRNANAQVQLIDDLLDVSRVVSGKMRLDVRPTDLRAVIDGALDGVRPAAEAKGIRIQSVLDSAASIMGDPNRLQQVVWNLLMNAVKFTPKGGRVQIHLQRVNSHVEIVVSDTGQGIAPHVLPFIFDRFTQADTSSTRAHSGLGLGLALVKHLVELHGGAVTAQSPGEGRGATFVISLPLSIAEMSTGSAIRQHPTVATTDAPLPGARLDGLRVLVVDDDQNALDLASAILTKAGAAVRTCLSAEDALAVFFAWRPDVLVSDIEMPGEDGYSLIRKVRALADDPVGDTPAVALTAYGRTQDRMLSLSAGYNMHVPKPVDPGELTTIIASLARQASGARGRAHAKPRPAATDPETTV